MVALEADQGGLGTTAERTVDRPSIVTEFTETLLGAGCRTHRAAAMVAVPIPSAAVTSAIMVMAAVVPMFIPAPAAEEEIQRPCFGDACRTDEKGA